ncbi:MAG: DNA primase [Candidatus Hydrogenedentota bacterium]|nr:MAG: DNA primase [Candidatus Hydrogenedentota bacterium]
MSDRREIETIRERIPITELVGEFVTLKRAGANFKGLCPFHDEKTPSFFVNDQHGYYKCFGCGESGDIFTFLQKISGISFGEALRQLADRAGVRLTKGKKRNDQIIDALYEINESAAAFYHEILLSSRGKEARKYLQDRGITPEYIDKFRLGLAPDSWDSLLKKFRKTFSEELLEKSGLFRKRNEESGFYDLFRNRILFPIFDPTGRVVAFGGRIWREEETSAPKYVNSPETPIYTKGRTLYGFPFARTAIRRSGYALLLEGYTDVVLAHSFGFAEACAGLGTALTQAQCRILSRLTDTVLLVYDADEAGERAADRGISLCLEAGLNVRIVLLPPGADPASFLLDSGATAFGKRLAEAEDIIEYRIRGALKKCRSVADRAREVEHLMASFSSLKNPLLRATLVKTVSERFGIPERSLQNTLAVDARRPSREEARPEKYVSGKRGAEFRFLRLLIDQPILLRKSRMLPDPEDFTSEEYRSLYCSIREAIENNEPLTGDLGGRLDARGLALIAEIATSEMPLQDPQRQFLDYSRQIKLQRVNAEISKCTSEIEEPASPGSSPDENRQQLLKWIALKKKLMSSTGNEKFTE